MSFEHKKSLGQNFLNSDYVPKKMCDAAVVTTGDIVLEIGPGTGALTKELLLRGAKVVAVEADSRAVEVLKETFTAETENGALQLHQSDARELDVESLGLKPQQYKVVSNIPYYLSGLLLRTILDSANQPTSLVFLIQKELAERIARDKKESLLSLSVKAFGQPSYICTIKRGHFTPAPKVDSAILAINNINQANFKEISAENFFKILHIGFGSKRKQLQGNLSQHYEKSLVEKALATAELPAKVRAEDVPLQKWFELVIQLSST